MASREIIALNETTPQLLAPQTGDSYLAPRKILVTPEVNTNALAVTGFSLTGSNASSLLDLAGTWNTSGTPTALKLNVTDTASNASSLLMDLQVGGVSKVAVTKGGIITSGAGNSYSTVKFSVAGSSTGLGYHGTETYKLFLMDSGAPFIGGGGSVASVSTLGFGSSVWNNVDVFLQRDAANTLALRNGTAAQAFNLYGTYTDASNYRRAVLTMTTAGVVSLSATGAGTGASGNVLHISSLPTSNPGPGILWNNAGTPAIGT